MFTVEIKYNKFVGSLENFRKEAPESFSKGFLSFPNPQKNQDKSKIYTEDKTLSSASGSLDSEEINPILEKAKQLGWKDALKSIYSDNRDFLVRMFSKNRINWFNLINTEGKRLKVLELGSGMGGVSTQLSKYCDVVALDMSPSNTAFTDLVSKQEKSLNLISINSQLDYLPFADEQFDLVCLIGSIEWLAYYHLHKSPQEIVKKYLDECYRVLKKNGKIYVATENASFIAYFHGLKEAHTALSYVSLLDFDKANQVSSYFKKQRFSEITYNHKSMSALLSAIGFHNIDYYWLHPDYSTPAYIVPLNKSAKLLEYFVEQRLNPWDFQGEREFIYKFYKLLDKELLINFVEHYGTIAEK